MTIIIWKQNLRTSDSVCGQNDSVISLRTAVLL